MNPTIWLVLFIAALCIECVRVDLMAASFAPGALVSSIMGFVGLPVWMQVIAFVAISGLLFVFARPELARYMNRQKRKARLERLIGKTGIVTCEIYNAHNVGVVRIDDKEYRARSNKPNAVIDEGVRVRVVTMRGDIAVVEEIAGRSTGRLPGLDGEDFD